MEACEVPRMKWIFFILLSSFVWVSGVFASTVVPVPQCGGYRIPPGSPGPGACSAASALKAWRAGDAPVVLFLNFDGAVITKGSDDPEHNTSWIPDYQSVTIPPFDAEPYIRAPLVDRQQVIDAITGFVRHYYSPFNVVVTSVRPASGTAYTMMMVGGTADLITPSPGGMVGVSPFDCGNSSKYDVAYCFAGNLGSLGDIVTTIVHESGHSFGLAHEDNPAAIMNPYVTSDPDWGEGTVPDGTACDGSRFQNSMNVLSANLGTREDRETPWVDFLHPGDGARINLPLTVNIVTGDEDSLGVEVELFLDDQSMGKKKWPYFSWRISSAQEGRRQLRAVVRDRAGNSSSTTIQVTVDSACLDKDNCTNGKSAVGEYCRRETSCQLGLCVVTEDGSASWCSAPCQVDTSACAPGMVCLPTPDGRDFYCAQGSDPVMPKTLSGDHRLSCRTAAGRFPGHISLPFVAFFVLGLMALRRRRR